MVSYVGLTDRQTGHPYRPPYRRVSSARLSDLQTARLTERRTERQLDLQTARLTGRFRSSGQTGQPHQ